MSAITTSAPTNVASTGSGAATSGSEPEAPTVKDIVSKINSTGRISIQQDTLLEFPELWLEVWLTGSSYEQKQFAEMFARARCYKAKSPETADVVVFAGGPDIDPQLYGVPDTQCHPSVHIDHQRDLQDVQLFNLCKERGIPMFGVCRGAQLLAALNGGTLYQDVDNHNGSHAIYDVRNRRVLKNASSVHHQMVRKSANIGMEVIATSRKSNTRWLNKTDYEKGQTSEVEAFFFRDTCSIGVQGHPEYRGYSEFTIWCLELLDKYINVNPDLILDNPTKNRRINPDLIKMRKQAKVFELN